MMYKRVTFLCMLLASAMSQSAGSGCTVSVSAAQRSGESGQWTDGAGLINTIYDVTVVNDGRCPAVDIGINFGNPEGTVLGSKWNINSTIETNLITNFGDQLASGSTFNGAGFILKSDTAPTSNPTLTVYGVNCPDACFSSDASSSDTSDTSSSDTSSSDTSSSDTSSSDTSSSGSDDRVCPAAAQSYIAIAHSSYNGTYGIATSSASTTAAYAYALQGCLGQPTDPTIIQCAPVFFGQNTCAALAVSSKTSTPYEVNNYLSGAGSGSTKAEAEAAALSNCECLVDGLQDSSVTCAVKLSGCSL